jgi:hypothetical protein
MKYLLVRGAPGNSGFIAETLAKGARSRDLR